jgi:hypothetical protein
MRGVSLLGCCNEAALAAEHAPHGPTEEHLVEQLEGLVSAVVTR